MICHGTDDSHCCWIEGSLCPHLEENTVPGRRWACGLRRRAGNWDDVYLMAEYQATDAARWFAEHFPGQGCGDWPQRTGPLEGSGLCCFGDS
jgi:hypothetical protein